MEGNENLVLKQEQKFDTSIVKIEPDLTIQFEERICVKKEPFELRPAAEHHNGKDNMTFRVPSHSGRRRGVKRSFVIGQWDRANFWT